MKKAQLLLMNAIIVGGVLFSQQVVLETRQVHAADGVNLTSLEGVKYRLNDGIKPFPGFSIKANESGQINPEFGLTIIAPEQMRIVFERTAILDLKGSAVEEGKVNKDNGYSYTNDGLGIHIDVLAPFETGDELRIEGVQIRIYEAASRGEVFGLDINGDSSADIYELVSSIRIENVFQNDYLKPYPVQNLEALFENNEVKLSWINPPDIDTSLLFIKRRESETSAYEDINVYSINKNSPTENVYGGYIDSNIQEGKTYDYQITAVDDYGYLSPPKSVQVESIYTEEVDDTVPPAPEDQETTLPDDTTNSQPEEQSPIAHQITDFFDDVDPGNMASEAIINLYNRGIVKGRSYRKFEPKGTALRSEFSKMITLGFNLPYVNDSNSFPDVPSDAWYAEYISAVMIAGIMQGDNGLAAPSREISRAEAVAMVIRAIEYSIGEVSQSSILTYPDIYEDDWYYEVIQKAKALQLLDWLKNEEKFSPATPINREELSVLISKAIDFVDGK